MTQTLREYAAAQVAGWTTRGQPVDRSDAVDRWVHHLIATGQVPDDILEALPEVSRHNEPQVSPQMWECGCTAMTRITDRDTRHDEKPFEMRLALACDGTACPRVCRYCGQARYEDLDGGFECGGEGDGICSFWSAISAYQRAGRPEPLESWLDAWILDEVGMGWEAMGWDREAHAKAIHSHLAVPR